MMMTRRDVIVAGACAAGDLFLGGCGETAADKMVYREIGRTGLKASVIGFGAEWMERHTAEECAAIVRRCEHYGINLVDCWMADPAVRSKIGDAIAPNRKRWIVQGHFGSVWKDGKYEKSRDPALCRASFEDLLKRFHTDYVDLGMIYYVDSVDEFNEIVKGPFMDLVREFKAAGKIRHVGLSTHNPLVGQAAVKSGLVEMIMFSVNPAYDVLPPIEDLMSYYAKDDKFESALGGIAPERAELYRLCEANGVGITVMKAYAGGRLFDANRSPFKTALTPVQCLHYALTRPAVASVLPGYDTVAHVDDAVRYLDATSAERDYATVLAKAPRHAWDGECTYCGHCAPCQVGIDIAMVNKLYDLAVAQPTVPDSVREHYLSLKHKAGACTGCKRCEARCPFHVPIAAKMKKAAALFGA